MATTRKEKEMLLELNFWKDMCEHLTSSDETGFKTLPEAAQILGINPRELADITYGLSKYHFMIPIPWIRWMKARQEQGFIIHWGKNVRYKKRRA